MAELSNPEQLLKTIKPFPPLARVVLATAGTLQTTLSAYFGVSVGVEVLSQTFGPNGPIHRRANLVRADDHLVVCRASALIHVDRRDAQELIVQGRRGLGEILLLLEVPTSFDLSDVGEEDGIIWRRYQLTGHGISYTIREEFSAALLRAGGQETWPTRTSRAGRR